MPGRKKSRKDYLIDVPDDGLLTYDVGPWAAEKYRRIGMYAEIFATGMKRSWDARVYLDLFSGPGHARIRESGRTVLGSPLIAMSLPDKFDRYVFADEDERAIDSLRQRVEREAPEVDVRYIGGEANKLVDEVIEAATAGLEGSVLSFCFLDPYKLNLHFDTVRRLASMGPTDFLILLALHVDANRNMQRYAQEESHVIDRFLGDREWRTRWQAAEKTGGHIVQFLAHEYAERMSSIGYIRMALDRMVKIRTYEKRLPLYYLAFFSKNSKGIAFWQEVLKYSEDQLPLL